MFIFYLCFLAGGAVLPVFNYVMGFLSNGMGPDMESDIDVNTDIHTDIQTDIHTDVQAGGHSDIVTHQHLSNVQSGESDHLANMSNTNSIFAIGLIPTSLLSISTLAIVFGAAGAIMTLGNWNKVITFVVAAGFGYLFAVIMQTIINSLKKAQTNNNGLDEKELALYDGKVIDTILPCQYGTVSFSTLKNVLVSYPAKCSDENMKLETGRIVTVKEFKNGIFIVEPKNKYE